MDQTTRENRWRALGLEPLPLAAPAYRLLGLGPSRVWLAPYDPERWSLTPLDDRWVEDRSNVPSKAAQANLATELRRGDVVVWVGETDDPHGKSQTIVWPPALVAKIGKQADGYLPVTTVRDSWLREIEQRAVIEYSPGLAVPLKLVAAGTPTLVSHSLLGTWNLDVWCPHCGHLGTPILWGMALATATTDDRGNLKPWPEGMEHIAGCIVEADSPASRCDRCGTQWGKPGPAGETWWPNHWDSHEPLATNEQLLQALNCAHWDALTALAEGAVAPFTLLSQERDDNNPGYFGWIDESGLHAVDVALPASEADFWLALNRAEMRARCAVEANGLREEIRAIEGFAPPLVPLPTDGGLEPWDEPGLPQLPAYGFERRAPDSWTLARWRRGRLDSTLSSARMKLVTDFFYLDGRKLSGKMNLGRVRQLAEEGQLLEGDDPAVWAW